MKVKILLLTAVILSTFALASFVIAEDPPQPVLKASDVKQFIKTFPLMKEDFKEFGASHEARSGNVTYPEALKANQEFLGILKKHGWDEHFFQKFSAILVGYSAIVYKDEMKKAEPGIEKAMKEIESNPGLSEAMKEQLLKQMQTARGALSRQQDAWHTRVHNEDIELVRPFVKELKQVLEERNN